MKPQVNYPNLDIEYLFYMKVKEKYPLPYSCESCHDHILYLNLTYMGNACHKSTDQ